MKRRWTEKYLGKRMKAAKGWIERGLEIFGPLRWSMSPKELWLWTWVFCFFNFNIFFYISFSQFHHLFCSRVSSSALMRFTHLFGWSRPPADYVISIIAGLNPVALGISYQFFLFFVTRGDHWPILKSRTVTSYFFFSSFSDYLFIFLISNLSK